MSSSKLWSTFKTFVNSPMGPRTTHFWGPVMNTGFVVQGLIDWERPPEKISKNLQIILTFYAMTFMRFAWRIEPRNLKLMTVYISIGCVQGRLLIRRILWENEFPELAAAQHAESIAKEAQKIADKTAAATAAITQ